MSRPGRGSADAPCRAPHVPAEAGHHRSTKDSSSRSAPTPRGYKPGTPSTDRSPGRPPTYSAGIFPRAATASPASPPMRSVQPAFTRTRCALGPDVRGYSPFAPRPREAYRLLQSKRSVSTPGNGPNSDTYAGASSCWSKGATRESSTHRVSTGQGPRDFRPALAPPGTTARLGGFTPTYSTRAPLVANPCHAWCGKRHAQRPCGNLGSFERTRLAHHALRAAHREGCRGCALAKEAQLQALPRVPSAVELSGKELSLPVRPARSRDGSRCRLGVAFVTLAESRR